MIGRCLIALQMICLAVAASAMEIESRYSEGSMLLPPMLTVRLTGEIVSGDREKLATELAVLAEKPVRDIIFEFDSPGGSLIEGIMIGELIASRREMTVAHIRSSQEPICASACVYAYLGAAFRYIDREAKLGVHKFYSTEEMSSAEAMARGQDLSAIIVAYLRERAVDGDFFLDIVSAPGDGISWISHDRLAELGVVSQGVKGKTVEYRNIEGTIYLRVEQDAFVGRNRITIQCGNAGPIGLAFLQEPPDPFQGPFMIHSGGLDYQVHDYYFARHGTSETIVGFSITPAVAAVVAGNSSIGAKVFNPEMNMSYGFEGEVRDPKIREMVDGCMKQFAHSAPPPSPPPPVAPQPRAMSRTASTLR